MPSRLFVRVCAFVVTCAFALAACTGSGDDDEGDTSSPPEPKPAALEPAWTAPAPENQTAEGSLHEARDGRVLYVRGGTVRAYDAGTGERAWTRSVPRACSASEPNKAGDVALTLGKQCRDVAVVDGRTGKVRWRTHIPTVSAGYDSGNVIASIGDRTVTVIQFCDQVTRLSLRDGKRLGILAPKDRACANEADSDGQLIAVWHDPETSDTPDDHGTGWIPSWDGEAAFELYDADTGKRLWRRAVDRSDGTLQAGAVVSSEPVILGLTDGQHATMRKYSRTRPKPGRYVGRQLPRSNGAFEPIGVADGVLIGTYVDTARANVLGDRLFAYDLGSGRELWSRPYPGDLGAAVAGVDEDGVIVTKGESRTDADGESVYSTWIERWDLQTGESVGLVGRIDEPGQSYGPSVWEVAGGMLYAAGADLRAYELPEPDPDLGLPQDVDWAEDDVQPDPFSDPCTAVGPATLRELGMKRSVALPAPADCTWIEHGQPDHSDRGLLVNVTVAEPEVLPGQGADTDGKTATENAKALVKERAEAPGDSFGVHVTSSSSHPPMSEPKPLDGVGDEAYASTGAIFSGDGGTTVGSYLIVRERNVVVEVMAEGSYEVAARGAAPPSLYSSERGVIGAAQDVLTQLELDFTAPQTPSDEGRFTRVGGVCRALHDDVTALGLEASPPIMPAGSDRRAAECVWSENADLPDDLWVHAYAAAPSPLTGETAVEVAERLFRVSGGERQRLGGLGDEAAILRDDDTWAENGYANSDREIVVRKKNLVIQLAYSHWGQGVGDQIERDAIRWTRRALRTAE